MRLIIFVLAFLVAVPAAIADDWTVVRVRGQVLQLLDGAWHPLERGAVVPDSRVIRTLRARATLVRGREAIELGPNTQVQIYDEARRGAFTTVKQYFGEVEIEAEVQNVEHFAVQTPFLVAVVKGTRFVVESGRAESIVSVKRGHVFVENRDSRSHVTVSAGQSVGRQAAAELVVKGRGELPLVVDKSGIPVGVDLPPGLMVSAGQMTEKELKELLDAQQKAAKGAEKAADKAAKQSEAAAKGAEKAAENGAGESDKESKKKGKDK